MNGQPSREAVLEREARWSLPVTLATFAAIGLLIVSAVVVSSVSGDGEAEILRAANAHSSDITLSSLLQALGFALLMAPLVYLFGAVRARSDKVRAQLIGLVIVTPLFLAATSVLNGVATKEAATDFIAGKASTDLTVKEATEQCRSDRKDDGSAFGEEFGSSAGALRRCATRQVADEEAKEAVSSPATRSAATGFGLAGRLGLAFTLVYTCLWAMRTGLLSRFWGSLGMALGVASLLLLIQFTLIWFLYFGLLVAGWLPGGRPPAWAAGEAVPWPTPGERASKELAGDGEDPSDGGTRD